MRELRRIAPNCAELPRTLSPGLIVPCSTFPSMTQPRSLYFERIGSRSGAVLLRSSSGSSSSVVMKVPPSHHGATSPTGLITFCAVSA